MRDVRLHEDRAEPPVSRRTVLKVSVGTGAAMALVGAVGAAFAAPQPQPAGQGAPAAGGPDDGPDVVVQLLDPAAGRVDVYAGGRHLTTVDADLAARLRTAGGDSSRVVAHLPDRNATVVEVYSTDTVVRLDDRALAAAMLRATRG
ncbi:hypothetical protein Cme02nite_03530 [Catellatospora methionotrophica]|uniref:Uncharacterized protein n=1 Tax=Catellatospora methionotrophica TaxID=121620 RepID=A0A8J3LBJ2_9ACTN|nr:hypothetical protein [Catellatospora methionotrophica]GIG12021.1 hypothetical protein Cme02nite_03530 [Catellatospora methionotrophica]